MLTALRIAWYGMARGRWGLAMRETLSTVYLFFPLSLHSIISAAAAASPPPNWTWPHEAGPDWTDPETQPSLASHDIVLSTQAGKRQNTSRTENAEPDRIEPSRHDSQRSRVKHKRRKSPSMGLRPKGDRRRGESESGAPPCISNSGRMNGRANGRREHGGDPDPDDILLAVSRLAPQKRNSPTLLPSSSPQPSNRPAVIQCPNSHLSVLDPEHGRAEQRRAEQSRVCLCIYTTAPPRTSASPALRLAILHHLTLRCLLACRPVCRPACLPTGRGMAALVIRISVLAGRRPGGSGGARNLSLKKLH